jgi:hypothetical protein
VIVDQGTEMQKYERFYVLSDFDPLTFGQVRPELDPRSSPPPSSHQLRVVPPVLAVPGGEADPVGCQKSGLGRWPAVILVGHDPNVSLRLLYLIFSQVLGLLLLMARTSSTKDAGRHL